MDLSHKPNENTTTKQEEPKPEPNNLKLTANWRDIVRKVNESFGNEVSKKVINDEIIGIFSKFCK